MNNRQLDGGIINIAGALSRIGTTTQCFQLIRFLQRSGYTAAYIECNTQNYIAAVYEQNIDLNRPYTSGTKVTCFDIDMYPKEFLDDFSDGNCPYDFLICDYGNSQLGKFHLEGYLSGDARIMVGGWEPNERIELTRWLLKCEENNNNPAYANIIYMLSFIDKEIEPIVRDMMGTFSKKTFCAPYTPDPVGIYTMQDADMWPKVMYYVGESMKYSRKPKIEVLKNA